MWDRVLGGVLAAIFIASITGPSSARPVEAQLPNLVALPPFDIDIRNADRESLSEPPRPAIRFATGAANLSDYALELTGEPSSSTEAVAQQCVAWAAPRVCTERKSVGVFAWHPAHGHYHFEDFALYELRRLRPDGEPNMRKRGLVATSGKVSFCIIDVEQEESRGALYAAPYPLYYSCFAAGVQGISPGWRDIYGESTIGQQIPLEGIKDGDYALVVYIDPLNRIVETSDADNQGLARIRLSENGTRVEVLCVQDPRKPGCVAAEESS